MTIAVTKIRGKNGAENLIILPTREISVLYNLAVNLISHWTGKSDDD